MIYIILIIMFIKMVIILIIPIFAITKLINTILIYLVFYQSDISWQSVSTDQLFSSCNVTSSPNGVDTSTYKALTLATVAADG